MRLPSIQFKPINNVTGNSNLTNMIFKIKLVFLGNDIYSYFLFLFSVISYSSGMEKGQYNATLFLLATI